MGMLRNHINTVGVEAALGALGDEEFGDKQDIAFAGSRPDISQFATDYLDRVGISLLPEGEFSDHPVISAAASSSDKEGWKKGKESDIFPALQTFKNKLEEAQHLPGLESSEDLSQLMGGEFGAEVPQFTPEVFAKLDEKYGKDKWIVKSYDDAAYAGFGIFFPQKAKRVQQEAQNTIWSAGEQLSKYGFELMRNNENKIIGVKHQDGNEFPFGKSKEDDDGNIGYPEFSDKIFGDVQEWAMRAARAAPNESGAALPRRWLDAPSRYMAQPAFAAVGISDEERAQGVTFKKGQEGRVHITTKNGKAQIVRHATWMKEELLPVVFESEDTLAMAQAALHAIDNLPESERQGQVYAPDVMFTGEGYKVVEANPSNEAGSSGYLQDNAMVMDSYVSQLTGREPAHVKFIRKLLTNKVTNDSTGTNSESGKRSSEGGNQGRNENDSAGKTKTSGAKGQGSPEKAKALMEKQGLGSLAVSDPDQRWVHPPEQQHEYNNHVLDVARKAGTFTPPENYSFVTKNPNVGGNEHDVHFDADNNQYYKFTKGGHFGQNKDLPEYLDRLKIANELWPELGYKFHGITQSPFDGTLQAVTSMNGIAGTKPNMQEIEDWFKGNGWEPNDERWEWPDGSDAGHWSWKDPQSGTVISDAHFKNFIKTKSGGLVPIDVDILPGKGKR